MLGESKTNVVGKNMGLTCRGRSFFFGFVPLLWQNGIPFFFFPFFFCNSLDGLASFGRPALFIGFPPISSKDAPWPSVGAPACSRYVSVSTCLSALPFLPVRATLSSGKCLPSDVAPFFSQMEHLFLHKCHLSSTPF